ncbi:hypothetical protein CNR22_13280 [Sphingobacteriaceae bacterium]|nr:hypothetical protein CNR22_13280 [Sphingobacteriaceae bacterium]
MQHSIGEIAWNYVVDGDRYLFNYVDGDHGVGFELPLIILEKLSGLKDPHDICLMRHLATHVFFLLSAFFFYKLCFLLYSSRFLGVVAFLLFAFHPVLYGHSFFNTKDLPFLSLFTICLYLAAKLFQNKNILNTVVLGICLGVLVNIRMMGLLLLFSVLFFLSIDAIREKKYFDRHALILLFVAVLALYGSWPYLWEHPIERFMVAFKSMSHYAWTETNLYDGKNVPGNQIGWEYIPLWFAVTTPLPWLLAGLFGIGAFVSCIIKEPFYVFDLQGKMNVLFLICFFVPILAVIALHSVVYDSWRHLFFIYPSFCMLLLFGLNYLMLKYKKIIRLGSALSFSFVIGFTIFNFPFGHVYFSPLVSLHSQPEYLRKHYDMDYWGTSYKQSLEYILAHDSSALIKVFPENYPGNLNAAMLPPEQRKRILIVPNLDEATYFVTNYRFHPQDYAFEDKKVYTIKVLNSTINAVYKLR